MKARVLLHKETGNLVEGYRVSFFDKPFSMRTMPGYEIRLDAFEHDGWILFNRGVSEIGWFFNRSVGEDFEDLGELE